MPVVCSIRHVSRFGKSKTSTFLFVRSNSFFFFLVIIALLPPRMPHFLPIIFLKSIFPLARLPIALDNCTRTYVHLSLDAGLCVLNIKIPITSIW